MLPLLCDATSVSATFVAANGAQAGLIEPVTPRLIAIDMDGTLLDPTGRVSARNKAALQNAEAAGVEIVIATGRRHGYAMGVLRDLGLRGGNALVSSNGTVVRTIASDLVHRHHMPLSTARWLCGHVAEFRKALVFTFDTVAADGSEQVGALLLEEPHELQQSIGRWMEANRSVLRSVPDLESALAEGSPHGPPIQAMLCGTVSRMRAAEARLLEHSGVVAVGAACEDRLDAEIALHRTEYPERDLSIVDILPAGCSKASALEKLTANRGITHAEVLAIGDNWNDLPMLAFAGTAVVMANAPADFRAFAGERGWTVGLSNEQDGVADAIETALGCNA